MGKEKEQREDLTVDPKATKSLHENKTNVEEEASEVGDKHVTHLSWPISNNFAFNTELMFSQIINSPSKVPEIFQWEKYLIK